MSSGLGIDLEPVGEHAAGPLDEGFRLSEGSFHEQLLLSAGF